VENGVTYKHDYNTENRISAIHRMDGDCGTGTLIESWVFAYDGDGVRTTTVHYTGTTPDSSTFYYFGGAYEVTGTNVRKYYSFAGQMVAVRACPNGTCSGLNYLLTDHLGSVVAVTDSAGVLLTQQRYLPFGEERDLSGYSMSGVTDYTYTGQRSLGEGMGGLMDYRARFYSPVLGRFVQPDTLIPNAQNPQAWNRFSYVANRPVNFNDPTGHFECNDPDGCEGPNDDNAESGVVVGGGGVRRGGGGGGGNGGGGGSPGSGGGGACNIVSGQCVSTDQSLLDWVANGSDWLKDRYALGWTNFNNSLTTFVNPEATIGQRAFSYWYMWAWGGAHLTFAAGATVLVWEAIFPGSMSCVMNSSCGERIAQTAGQVVDDLSMAVYGRFGGVMERLTSSPGWRITLPNASLKGTGIVARIVEYSTTRAAPYFRVSVPSAGPYTSNGVINTVNQGLTHININMVNPSETLKLITWLIGGAMR
jgi:RHS repeat-associated protein